MISNKLYPKILLKLGDKKITGNQHFENKNLHLQKAVNFSLRSFNLLAAKLIILGESPCFCNKVLKVNHISYIDNYSKQ